MRDFEDSTLWRISAFEQMRQQTGSSGFARLSGPTLLPTTLLADLRRLDADPASSDAMEVIAACLRHREAALVCVEVDGLVWPVTVFPQEDLYHSPRNLLDAPLSSLSRLRVVATEPPGVRPPGHWMHERIAQAEHYRSLPHMLWRLALHGPRNKLLADISGPAMYRLVASGRGERPHAPGALGSAIERLQLGSVGLAELSRWPGMSTERASRLLNALYLSGCLMTTRAQTLSRTAQAARGLFGWKKSS